MNKEFEVVTDVSEIVKLNDQLARLLRGAFKYEESRQITYPAGHHTGSVRFERKNGQRVRAWSRGAHHGSAQNFLLYGEPGSTKWMEIAVQLNFPVAKYNRSIAGAFVKDVTGNVFVAHRGKLTKGHAGLSKVDVFEEFAPKLVDADDAGKTSTVILIAELRDQKLVDRLYAFATEAREVATKLGEVLEEKGQVRHDGQVAQGGKSSAKKTRNRAISKNKQDHLSKLRGYFREHSGEGRMRGRAGGKRIVKHGDIVDALKAHMQSRGLVQKSQAIDLAVIESKRVSLFEVKTSARTTDVYTGVGQLLIHGESIAALVGSSVVRYLVLPERPRKEHEGHIVRKGKMHIVTYEETNGRYSFTGV